MHLDFPNQFPITATTHGQPVDWKRPVEQKNGGNKNHTFNIAMQSNKKEVSVLEGLKS